MSSKLTDVLCAADTDAAVVLCDENLETSIPVCARPCRTQLVRVCPLTSS